MGRVKSALEIALERSSRLVEEDAGRSNAWEEQQYRAVGENLARRFLQEGFAACDLAAQLERYQGKAREAVERTAAAALAAELSLANYARVLEGIGALKKDEATARWLAETRRACEQFRAEMAQDEQEAAARWSARQREELARGGIAGSAVAGFNFRAAPEWQHLRGVWEERLEAIRRRLVEYLTG